MTTLCVIAAVLILIAGLFAVIVERTNERDDARAERDRLERELEARPRLRLVPRQREPEHDHLKADDDWFARLYDEKGDLR